MPSKSSRLIPYVPQDLIQVLELDEQAVTELNGHGYFLVWQLLDPLLGPLATRDLTPDSEGKVMELLRNLKDPGRYLRPTLQEGLTLWSTGTLSLPLDRLGLSTPWTKRLEKAHIHTTEAMLFRLRQLQEKPRLSAKLEKEKNYLESHIPYPMREHLEEDPMKRAKRYAILDALEGQPYGLTTKDLCDQVKKWMKIEDAVDLVDLMLQQKQLQSLRLRVLPWKPPVKDFVTIMKRSKKQKWETFDAYLDGMSQSMIAKNTNRTRQAVSIACNSSVRKPLDVWENTFKGLFEHYKLDASTMEVLSMDPSALYYLELAFPDPEKKRQLREIDEIADDPTVPPDLRDAILDAHEHREPEAGYYVNGVRIPATRKALLLEALKIYAKDPVQVSEFAVPYTLFVIKVTRSQSMLYSNKPEALESLIRSSGYVIQSRKRYFRYYPTKGKDFKRLWDGLDLGRFQNAEISVRKLYLDFPALMKEFDLRDEYELHNLLRRTLPAEWEGRMDLSRMPMITFGHPSRQQQLQNSNPTSMREFTSEYSRLYGIANKDILSSYLDKANLSLRDHIRKQGNSPQATP